MGKEYIRLFNKMILTDNCLGILDVRCPCGRLIPGFVLEREFDHDCPCGRNITITPIQYQIDIEEE